MSRSQTTRVLFVLVLAAALAAPCRAERADPLDFLTRMWSSLSTIWAEVGCSIDPHGGCTTDTPPPGTDEGCSLDPNGRCTAEVLPPPPSTDEGCSIDPNGGCTAGS